MLHILVDGAFNNKEYKNNWRLRKKLASKTCRNNKKDDCFYVAAFFGTGSICLRKQRWWT